MSLAATRPSRELPVVATACALTAAVVLSLAWFMTEVDYDIWGGVVLGFLLAGATWPFLAAQARRIGVPALAWVLPVALVAKLVAAVVRYYVAFGIYGGIADATGYHGAGIRVSAALGDGLNTAIAAISPGRGGGIGSLTGTRFIDFVTGLVYSVTRPTILGGFVVFSWFAFLGIVLFVRAFSLVVPRDRVLPYAATIVFLPTMLFWPSSLGKEAWMTLSLGVTTLGAARWFVGHRLPGAVLLTLGALMCGVVRPNIAVIALFASATAAIFHVPSRRRPEWLLRSAILVAGVLGTYAISTRVLSGLLEMETGGFGAAFEAIREATSKGGSQFTPYPVAESPLNLPLALVTVLFRPFPMEVGGPLELLAALEGVGLLVFALTRVKQVMSVLRHVRSIPLFTMAAAFVALFVVGFSSFANFGLLVRERSQVVPFLLIVLLYRGGRAPDAPDAAAA
ncbi:MAG: hypothetical protein ABR575_11205 [Actinomycetota bacterium]